MNTRELRTRLEKAETQPEIVVKKAETNLRQPEISQFELRLFRVYQILTSISQQKLNFLKQPPHTTIVDWRSAGILPTGSETSGVGMRNPGAIRQNSKIVTHSDPHGRPSAKTLDFLRDFEIFDFHFNSFVGRSFSFSAVE